ncbi:MAG TPA: hypothetical protein VNJ53_06385, partial [Gaiellaceae bacterium]|nr:hypothetical protein [Gaiellaceae bacterium]
MPMTRERTRSEHDPLDELFAADREEFVSRRADLVRELRGAGRREDAEALAALRKPSLPVFAANRLARRRPQEVAALLRAAQRLVAAHEERKPETLHAAHAELRERVRALVSLAEEASGQALSVALEQRLATTLRQAALDPQAAELLQRGVLQHELEPAGFERLAGLRLPEPARPRASGASGRAGAREREAR